MISKMLVPLPPLSEQLEIASSLLSLDELILVKKKKYSALQNNKKALMQDLLTGKVRVKVEN